MRQLMLGEPEWSEYQSTPSVENFARGDIDNCSNQNIQESDEKLVAILMNLIVYL